jgi:hypothetical protein
MHLHSHVHARTPTHSFVIVLFFKVWMTMVDNLAVMRRDAACFSLAEKHIYTLQRARTHTHTHTHTRTRTLILSLLFSFSLIRFG